MVAALGFGLMFRHRAGDGVAICAARFDWWIVHLRGTRRILIGWHGMARPRQIYSAHYAGGATAVVRHQ
jgi:hypothetical protein